MTITINTGPKGRRRAVVEGNMTIYEAAVAKQVLLDALAKAKELEVDVSSLGEMEAIKLGAVDRVCPLQSIPKEILNG